MKNCLYCFFIISSIKKLFPNKLIHIYTIVALLILVQCRAMHDDVIKWKHFPRNWPFVRGIHLSPVNSPHKDQWRGALMFSLICVWINDWVNNRDAGDLRRYRAHYDVIVMITFECLINVHTLAIQPPVPWNSHQFQHGITFCFSILVRKNARPYAKRHVVS